MKIYKYEFREFGGNQHSYDTRVVSEKYVLNNTERNRKIFTQDNKKFDEKFVKQGIQGNIAGYFIKEIDVSDY